jgi:hypothetical protein
VSDPEARHEVARAMAVLREQLGHLEGLVGPEIRTVRTGEHDVASPGWRRKAEGEERWPVTAAMVVAVALQVALPDRLAIGPRWLLPALEAALLIGLCSANPRKINRRSTALRWASLGLIAVISVANGWASYELIRGLVQGTVTHAGPLLSDGLCIYVTNIIVFGLWYWEWDRGGPVARAHADRMYPEFLFVGRQSSTTCTCRPPTPPPLARPTPCP